MMKHLCFVVFVFHLVSAIDWKEIIANSGSETGLRVWQIKVSQD